MLDRSFCNASDLYTVGKYLSVESWKMTHLWNKSDRVQDEITLQVLDITNENLTSPLVIQSIVIESARKQSSFGWPHSILHSVTTEVNYRVWVDMIHLTPIEGKRQRADK